MFFEKNTNSGEGKPTLAGVREKIEKTRQGRRAEEK